MLVPNTAGWSCIVSFVTEYEFPSRDTDDGNMSLMSVRELKEFVRSRQEQRQDNRLEEQAMRMHLD